MTKVHPILKDKQWHMVRELMRSRKRTRLTKHKALDTLPGEYVPARDFLPKRKALTCVTQRFDNAGGEALTFKQFMVKHKEIEWSERLQLWKRCLKIRPLPKARNYQGHAITLPEALIFYGMNYDQVAIMKWYAKLPRI